MKFFDELKLIFRKPGKFLIMLALSVLFMVGILLFIMSFLENRKTLSSIMDNYAVISTLVPESPTKPGEMSEFAEIEPEMVDFLNESSNIEKVELRDTMAGFIPDKNSTNIYFVDQASYHVLVFRGRVKDIYSSKSLGEMSSAQALLEVEDLFAGKEGWVNEGENIEAMINMDDNQVSLKEGDEYIFIGFPEPTNLGYLVKKITISMYKEDNPYAMMNTDEMAYVMTHGIIEDESDLDKDFLNNLNREIKIQDKLYNIRLVDDMSMILPIANETMFLIEGRFIGPDDFGKNICVISKELAIKHRLELGDKIDIGLAEEIYNNNGYVSAFAPMFEKSSYDFSDPRPYEIVGVYSYSNYHYFNTPMLYSFNDIFIPKFKEELNNDYIASRNLSFKVGVDSIDSFESDEAPRIEEAGYDIVSAENNWSTVKSSIDLIKSSMVKNLILGTLIGILGIFVLVFVNSSLNIREYTLRRIFAGKVRHIERPLILSLGLSLGLGFILAFVFVIGLGPRLLNTVTELEAVSLKPSDLLYLGLGGLIFIVISLLANTINTKRLARKDIVELMKS